MGHSVLKLAVVRKVVYMHRHKRILLELGILILISSSIIFSTNNTEAIPTSDSGNSLIAFVSERDGNEEIYVMNEKGENQHRLTHTPKRSLQPCWSPDGKKIVFISDRDNNWNRWQIYVMDSDGSNQINLTKNNASNILPAWSPDGKKISFASNRNGNGNMELYVMDADGSNSTRLTNTGVDITNWYSTWSPDSNQLAFISCRDAEIDLFIINIKEGGKGVRLTQNNGRNIQPKWSPDGKKIAFVSDRDVNNEIYLIDLMVEPLGSKQTRLTHTNNEIAKYGYPTWSPDGKQIIFTAFIASGAVKFDGNWSIYKMNADGSNQMPLLKNKWTDYLPACGPLSK